MISFRIWKKLSGQWQKKKDKNKKDKNKKDKDKKAAARIDWNRGAPPLFPQTAAEVSGRLLRDPIPRSSL